MNRYTLYFASVPMVRIVVPIIIGLMIQNKINFGQQYLLIGLSIGISILYLLKKDKLHRTSSGLLLTALLLLLGMFISEDSELTSKLPTNKKTTFIAKVEGDAQVKSNSVQYEISILSIDEQTLWPPEKSICYVSKNDDDQFLQAGQVFQSDGYFNQISSPVLDKNNGYKKYLNKQGYFTSVFIPTDQLQVKATSVNSSKYLFAFIHKARNSAKDKLLNIIHDTDVAGFLVAITLGDKTQLGKTQKQAFAQAGLMHMLAVSGLHLGIVIPLLMFVFGRRKKDPLVLIALKTILLLISIWTLAIFLGFSPSIQRAATMFSFLCIGKFSKYPVHSLNLLAASALFMIIGNNAIIYDIGFQLSYAAMVGIIMLYKPIVELWTIQHKIGDYIWKLSVVSICATLFTLPFSLFYFGTFPVLFIFTNILVLPVLPLLMYSTYALLLISTFFELGSQMIAFPLEYLGNYILIVAEICSSISWSSIQNIELDAIQVILLIVVLITLLINTYNKAFYKIAPFATFLLLMLYTNSKNIYLNTLTTTIAEENINKKPVLIYQKGQHLLVVFNEDRMLTEKEKQFNLYGTSNIGSHFEISVNDDQYALLSDGKIQDPNHLFALAD